jgi:GNAT superfamily N-acetyltransferase
MPDLKIHTSSSEIWDEFAEEIEGNENNKNEMGFNEPGSLSIELAKLCRREGTIDLDAQRIMYLSQESNIFIELLEGGSRIGFLLLDLPAWGEEAKIEVVCVSLSQKGKSYSKVLIDEAKRLAKEAGKKRLLLEALGRIIGEKVYKKQGFEFVDKTGENMVHQLGGKRSTKTKTKTRKMKRRNKA